MTFVYIVRGRFTAPEKEQAWNAWYSGPKLEQMLAQPYFRTCQRFRRAAGHGRDYLALWTVTTPEALQTKSYVAQWGFADWAPHITDWSRDLFDARHAPPDSFAVAADGALRVASFDGMDAAQAQASSEAIARFEPGLIWLPVAGLDRHTPLIGLQPLVAGSLATLPNPAPDGFTQTATYQPITALHRARAART